MVFFVMPNNLSVTDTKPSNNSVIDVKPRNERVMNFQPLDFSVTDTTKIYSGSYSLLAGMWIPFAGFTYPNLITGTKART